MHVTDTLAGNRDVFPLPALSPPPPPGAASRSPS